MELLENMILLLKLKVLKKLSDTIAWSVRKLTHVRSTLTLMGILGQNKATWIETQFDYKRI